MTRAHDDHIHIGSQDYGYSIRVGQKLPPNSVNLAYVHTPDVEPKTNLVITDKSREIVENVASEVVVEDTLIYPDDTFLLRELDKPFYTNTRNILVTDEFSIPKTNQEKPVPLYYQTELRYYFDAAGAPVSTYISGYAEQPISNIVNYDEIARSGDYDNLLYLGSKIYITNEDGTPLSSDKKYKIRLVHQEDGLRNKSYFRVLIYTNFKGTDKNIYIVHYEQLKPDYSKVPDGQEILNAYPFFSEVSKESLDILAKNPKEHGQWNDRLKDKQYAIAETEDSTWQLYAPSQVIIADNSTRPAHQFKYRIKGKLRTKFSTGDNQGTIKVGMVYLNNTVFTGENLESVLKKIYEHRLKPPYLDFENPNHPFETVALSEQEKADLKKNPKYWSIDLTMPSDYLNEYDLIILTGYGKIDMSVYSDTIRTYLQNGGRLWIDNAGTGNDVLELENFLINVGFSKTESSTGVKGYGIPDSQLDTHSAYSLERQAVERLYLMNKTNMNIGYSGVNPKIIFGVGESSNLWTTIVRYTNNDPAVMTRSAYSSGQVIVSNCGMFRSLANKDTDDILFVMNSILSIAEERYVSTPWIRDYVYHRDNLFKEEYKEGETDTYVDDRSDVDTTQIVAKKMIAKTVRDALIPYMPSSYYKAKGTFNVEVAADSVVIVENNDMEVGNYDPSTGKAITSWTTDQLNAIPGWNTKAISGSVTFNHTASVSDRGRKSIQITSPAGGIGYWYSKVKQLTAGIYRSAVWIKASNLLGKGLVMQVQTSQGVVLATSEAVSGTRDWVQIDVEFGLTATTDIEIRLGFLEENIQGTAWIDYLELQSIGSVYMTPENAGDRALYAYAIRPKGDSFDLKKEGFDTADVTVYDPEIEITYTIRAFVYKWDNATTQYIKEYGNHKTYKTKLRKSDGILNLGLLTTILPGLNAGSAWADQDKVFYEIFVGALDHSDPMSDFVNVAFFNMKTGQYYYSRGGEQVIGYNDIYNNNYDELSIVAQAWTSYYTIRATKRRYSVRPQATDRIYLEYPSTIDERKSWFLRIHNGEFIKKGLNYREYSAFYKDFVEAREYGILKYALPEYDRQIFKSVRPFRQIQKEVCEYIDEYTLKLQNTPLHVDRGEVNEELITSEDGIYYPSLHRNWDKNKVPKVWTQVLDSDSYIEEFPSMYYVDFKNGAIIFGSAQYTDSSTQRPKKIKVTYDYNNLNLFKRTYSNARNKKEPLKSVDGRTFKALNQNWMLYPNPVIYRLPYGVENEKAYIAPVDTYEIDYENGTISFKEDVNDRIFADYTNTNDKPLAVLDYDINNGIIYLQSSIQFKDEIYANYEYEEKYVEYRGYYDYDLREFIHLDLNPTDGHYCTMPKVYESKYTKYEQVPTSKLMNKDVYIYLMPYITSFDEKPNKYTIRHCYSKEEWDKIRATTLGRALLLGTVQLRETVQVKDVTVLDTRTRGGGLKETITGQAAKARDPLAASYWDMGTWDGMAYYRNGVIVIQLPRTLLQSEGGQFSEKDIEDAVKRYIAYGVYFIIEYVDPVITPTQGLNNETAFIQGATLQIKMKK